MSNDFVYGFNVLETLVRVSPQNIVQVFMDKDRRDDRADRLKSALEATGLSWQPALARKIDELAAGEHHQGVAAEVLRVPVLDEKGLCRHLSNSLTPLVCFLEGVKDPRNLGACLRSAEAAGVNACVLSRHDCCGLTPVVRHVAAGAAELVTVAQVSNLARVLKRLKQDLGVWVIGTDADADEVLYEVSFCDPTAMVFGSEDRGLKRLTRESCDRLVRIPMQGRVDSLNVSVAVGIGLFEATRQRTLLE